MVFFILNGKNSASGKSLFLVSFFVSVLLLVLSFEQYAYGISASPEALEVAQPDGAKIRIHTVVIDGGTYVYASLDDKGQLKGTNLVVGMDVRS